MVMGFPYRNYLIQISSASLTILQPLFVSGKIGHYSFIARCCPTPVDNTFPKLGIGCLPHPINN